jgi:hypothetical protein
MTIHVSELEFDDNNLAELEAHGISVNQVVSMLGEKPKFFPNRKGRTGTRLMVGPDSGGKMLSVPIIETPAKGRWRPTSGWPSKKSEIAKWRQAK